MRRGARAGRFAPAGGALIGLGGVAVMIEAEHMCMEMRGVQKQGSNTLTTTFTGEFKTNAAEQARFFTLTRGR